MAAWERFSRTYTESQDGVEAPPLALAPSLRPTVFLSQASAPAPEAEEESPQAADASDCVAAGADEAGADELQSRSLPTKAPAVDAK